MPDTESTQLFKWLWSREGPGWIFGSLTFALAVVKWLWDRAKPAKIICREEPTNRTLLRIQPGVRNSIQVLFHRRPVVNLSSLELIIFNSGSEVITDITLTIRF